MQQPYPLGEPRQAVPGGREVARRGVRPGSGPVDHAQLQCVRRGPHPDLDRAARPVPQRVRQPLLEDPVRRPGQRPLHLRRLAPRLLGLSAAERLALAAERELRLAERNRLAHELHDSIGHTLTATTIQAAVAGEVLTADPVAARAALRSIEESSRAALEDLDYALGVLREEAAGTAPQRTLADLPELLDRLRHAGAVVEPELAGELAQVQGTLSRAAYRILQEGLTNALRHGAGGPIQVGVRSAPDVLELSVVNRTGTRAAAPAGSFPTSGHGLPGLAERVRLLHGELSAGPDGDGRWRLAVRLPVRPTP